MLGGLVTALRTLTILPIPGKEAKEIVSSLYWFPIVGGGLGGILYGLSRGLNRMLPDFWPEGIAMGIVIGGIILTGGAHLDGLADWADSLGCSGDREKLLRVMKDSRLGAFGVMVLIVTIMLKWVALTRLLAGGIEKWVVIAYIVSRTLAVELATSFPYARLEGGIGAPFINNASIFHRLGAWLSGLILVFVLASFAGLGALVGGWFLIRSFGKWCHHRFGGMTGDLLGAGIELAETAILFFGSLIGKSLLSNF